MPHEFVVAGALPDFDGERLLADTRRLCEAEIRFWHGDGRAPFERYVFMLNALEDGRGGLEHRSSTALVAPRRDLPRRTAADAAPAGAKAETSDGYVGVLGLIAHEYFHAWNVKRLKPREFALVRLRAARTTPACSGSSKASPRTTTTCSCCAAA